VLVAPLAATIATSAPAADADVALGTVLGWAGPAWRAALLGAVLLAVVIVVVVVLRQRRALARHVLGTVVLIAAAGAVLGPDWLPVEGGAWSRCGFPEVRVAVAAAVVGVAGPELVRPVRVLGVWLVGSRRSGRSRLAPLWRRAR